MQPVVRLLGPVEVVVAGTPRPVPGLRRKAILALLALHAGEVVAADRLIDVAWDGEAPATTINTLQSHVSYLRRAFGIREALVTRAPGYLLDSATPATDLQLVESLVRQGHRPDDPLGSSARLRAALTLWRGEALAELREVAMFDEYAQRLASLRRDAVRALTDLRLALGEHAPLVAELEALADQHPFDEELHRQQMLALYRCGRPADALEVCRQVRRRLVEELGVDPGPRLRELEGAIRRRDASLDPPRPAIHAGNRATVAPPTSEALVDAATRQGLSGTPFIARHAKELPSVIVVDGPAGIGKSTLLASARDEAAAKGVAVVAARGLELERDYAWACARRLFDRRAVLPLDTPDGQSHVIADLLARAPVLIIVDDMHLCDSDSARFLANMAVRIDGLPIVILTAQRPDSTGSRNPSPSPMTRVAGAAQLRPRPLSANGSAAVLTRLLGRPADGSTLARCHELTGGNPLLLTELAKELATATGHGRPERGVHRGGVARGTEAA